MTSTRSIAAHTKALAAAAEVVRQFGVPGFTVDEVARRSGVAKTTIYRHWPSSNALLLEAVDCAIEHRLRTPNTGSLRGDLERFVGDVLPKAGDPDNSRMICGLLYAAAADADLQDAMRAYLGEQQTPLRTMVQLAQARGELPADLDLGLAVDLIEGPLLYRFLLRREPSAAADVARLLDMIVAGLQGVPAPASA
jgi:AcrR family transcriptional regulator